MRTCVFNVRKKEVLAMESVLGRLVHARTTGSMPKNWAKPRTFPRSPFTRPKETLLFAKRPSNKRRKTLIATSARKVLSSAFWEVPVRFASSAESSGQDNNRSAIPKLAAERTRLVIAAPIKRS